MEHLKFVEKLDKKGISIRSTQVEGENRCSENPIRRLVKEAIDIDEWNHSWHTEIKPENYDEIQDIIQKKILKRSEEIEFLLTVYFQINREKTNEVT